jgi:hypothetical protein
VREGRPGERGPVTRPRTGQRTGPGARRSLSHVGGAVAVSGDPKAAAELAKALDVEPHDAPAARGARDGRDGPDRAHVHGFHAYPARMHPVTAARLVRSFTEAGQTVLDPFCGSGTVLVEALLADRHAVGTDLNPLAVSLASLKTRPHDEAALGDLVRSAQDAAAFADARREDRAGATRRFPKEDVDLFEPHVLLELDGLHAGIARTRDARTREELSLVLSAILVKLSRKLGDTSERLGPRRLPGGHAARLFVHKTEELASRLSAFTRALPTPRPTARVAVDDAARLATLEARSIDAILSSPPYVGTYDYVAHHALRLRWLDLDASRFERGELGARRRFASLRPREAREAWMRELGAFFRAAARVLRPRRPMVLLMADSAIGREPLRADEVVARVAPEAGFRVVARASQQRPHFHTPSAAAFRHTARAEHALMLERA